MTTEAIAPAKINLSLHVTGQRADGYHLLDSLVIFSDIADRLWFEEGPQMRITVSGPFATGVPTDVRNLVWQAAELAGWTGHVRLEKNLPHGAGIGGGSSDAAAVLRMFGGAEAAATLGADVPVCLNMRPQRMRGIGDVLEPLPALPDLEIVLVNPNVAVPTGPVFSGLRSKQNAPMLDDLPDFSNAEEFCDWLHAQRNDLEAPARAIAPQVDDVLRALDGALISRMSGSGATCFGLFSTGAAEDAARIAKANPEWWVASGKVLK
ncbi:4-(cytidine 5'-diphospho)-2-C-methyl-D-erythritol kinase [Sulfitobacter sp.]|uniref:4-(cytidine 5'-diphospho)-2-C-methyl-D-erythritol kinase n=1 Tax=Sulfitobacter sp. TaxID=1903071 RepID=UPI0030019C9F